MANDIDRDEEYQFPQDDLHSADVHSEQMVADDADYQDEETSSVPSQKQQSPIEKVVGVLKALWKKNPRVVVVVGAIIVLIIIFSFVHSSSSQAQMLSAATDNTPPSTPVPVTQPAPTPTFSSALTSSADSGALKSIKASASSNQAAIANLQVQLEGLKSDLQRINQGQQTTDQAVVALSESVRKLTNALENPVKKKVVKPVNMVYNLRAIVSGRAWIVDQNGNSQSVTVGSHLKQYGTVQKILPSQGMVTTSSGKVIEFGQHVS